MKKITVLNTFGESEFIELCKSIIQDFLITSESDDSMRFTSPMFPIINVTRNNVDFMKYKGLYFNYNIMSHDATPASGWARIVHPLHLFQAYYFAYTPESSSACLKTLQDTILNSLEAILDFIVNKNKIEQFSETNYIFLSNLDFDLLQIDYRKWINENLNSKYSKVSFQVGTSISILNNLNNSKIVKDKYINIVNNNEPILIVPIRNGIQAVNFNFAGLQRLVDIDKNIPFNIYSKSNRRILELDKALEEFNELINDEEMTEEDLHRFFVDNPIFLTGSSYKTIRSKVVLEREEGNPLIPDFFLEPVYNTFWDILDLKRPKSKILVTKKNRIRFSSQVYEAVAQLRTYGTYFNDLSKSDLIKHKYGIQCYNPKLIVVIGNKHTLDGKLIKDAELDLNRVQIETYDELQQRVLNIRNWLSK